MSLAYLESVIRERRTTKPPQMNGKKIDDEIISHLIALADWAPTHGHTEPWRFFVFGGDKVNQFCVDHAAMYKEHVSEEKFIQGNFEKLLDMGQMASHVIVLAMKRGDNPKITELEEIASVSCAAQNLLLGAHAYGLASYWGSGGMSYHPAMKKYLNLREEDKVIGVLYLGYTDVAKEGKRVVALEDKVKWM